MARKIKVNRTVGFYRAGHEYTFEGSIPVIVRSAMRQGYIEAAGGWCAPSEAVYDTTRLAATDGLLDLPQVSVVRGGIEFPKPEAVEAAEQAAPKPRKGRKKAVPADTLESIAQAISDDLDSLRG